ncbi:hypothetical protein ACFWAT_10320 [Streptomyces syringium]|uniref:hypothetical protein n=1 Tax=Streptomyces syringium TaxID=76729 RepID=UPI0036635E61
MTTATFTPTAEGARPGATALHPAPGHQRHLLGSTIRAIKVFAGTAVSVVLLGEHNGRR